MNTRDMFRKAAIGSAMLGGEMITGPDDVRAATADPGELVIERDQPGRPHAGKVLLAVHAHLDDIPYYAGGTCAKLIAEGYTGYLLRASNDEKCGGNSDAMNIKTNEEENLKMAKVLGFSDVFDFYYRNHRMNEISAQEFRFRVMFLIRLLKVDTVVTFNPWGHGEENPDHWMTVRVVEECCWMSGMKNDYSDHFEAGLEPQKVRERYYFVGRRGQPFNRIVDVSSYSEQKIQSIVECKSQGGGDRGAQLRQRLARQGKKLPLLGDDDETANREYVRRFLVDSYRRLGKEYGMEYAERFLYIDQRPPETSEVQRYIDENAVNM